MTFVSDNFNRTPGDRLNVGLTSDFWVESSVGNYFTIDSSGRAQVTGSFGLAVNDLGSDQQDLSMTILHLTGTTYWFVDILRDYSGGNIFFRVQRRDTGIIDVCVEHGGVETILWSSGAGQSAGPNTWRFVANAVDSTTSTISVYRDGILLTSQSAAYNMLGHTYFELLGFTGLTFDDVINNLAVSTTVGRLSRISTETLVDPDAPASRLSRVSAETLVDPVSPAPQLSRISTETLVDPVAPAPRLSRISLEVLIKNPGTLGAQEGWGIPA